jgi:UDP-N-acetylmuramoyl-tripeptide--D-alanyl-D-alanine ligase
MKLSLSDLLKVKGKIFNSSLIENKIITGVSIDSRTCKKGDIFFAIRGEKFNGHDFINNAVSKGVKAAVVDEKWFKKNSKKINIALLTVKDTTKALGELASVCRDKFLIPFIAVAGSNGKTTAKDFIAHVLSEKYRVLKTEGNHNNDLGVPLTLFRLNEKHEIAVVETGTNHFGEVKNLCGILKPQFGVITNIGKEHLEFLKDIKGAAKAEFELAEYLQDNYGTFFYNTDDKEIIKRVSKKIKVFKYGQGAGNDVKGKIVRFKKYSPEVEINSNEKSFKALLKVTGKQSFYAALSAAAIGLYFDLKMNEVKKALSDFKLEKTKRNEMIERGGIIIIDDTYNSNPDSVKIALENLKLYEAKGAKHIVLSDMLELGESSKKEHSEAGRLIDKMGFENLYTYGKESFYTFTGALHVKNNFYFEDKNTLIDFLKLSTRAGDIVLVKGSRGMKMEEVVQEIGKDNNIE